MRADNLDVVMRFCYFPKSSLRSVTWLNRILIDMVDTCCDFCLPEEAGRAKKEHFCDFQAVVVVFDFANTSGHLNGVHHDKVLIFKRMLHK